MGVQDRLDLGYQREVSFDQIRYFVSVAEQGNVSRAAIALRVAQPAVSRQIKHLEDELGTRLFQRTSSGMRLSDPGTRFLAHAQRILDEVETAKRSVQNLEPTSDPASDGSPPPPPLAAR